MIKPLHLQQPVEHSQADVDFCEKHGLELELAPDYGWIVRAATAAHDGEIFGCIDQLKDCVELMQIHGGFRWTTFGALRDALEELVLQAMHAGEPDSRRAAAAAS